MTMKPYRVEILVSDWGNKARWSLQASPREYDFAVHEAEILRGIGHTSRVVEVAVIGGKITRRPCLSYTPATPATSRATE